MLDAVRNSSEDHECISKLFRAFEMQFQTFQEALNSVQNSSENLRYSSRFFKGFFMHFETLQRILDKNSVQEPSENLW